jgi:hypothetical protein
VKITFGTRASAMLSGIVLATAFVAGCTEEAATEKPATAPPAAVGSPAKPAGELKPAAPTAASPAPGKAEEKK